MAHILTIPAASPAAPSVEPAAAPPNDYQNISATPRQFGVHVGQAVEGVGQNLVSVGKVYGQVAAQQAVNDWQDETNKILFGDPAKPNDVGYYGLHGQAAMDARQGTLDALNAARQKHLGTLWTLESQSTFNNESRYMAARQFSEIGRHYDAESTRWAGEVNDASYKNAIAGAALNPADEGVATDMLGQATAARMRKLQVQGLVTADPSKMTPEQAGMVSREQRQAQIDVTEARIKSLLPRDAPAALRLLEANDPLLSQAPNYDGLSSAVRRGADRAADAGLVDQIFGGVIPGTTGPRGVSRGTLPNDAGALVKKYESEGLARQKGISPYVIGVGGADLSNAPKDATGFPQWEGTMGPQGRTHAAGAYQFEPATWRQYAEPLGIHDFSQASQDAVFDAAYRDKGFAHWAPFNSALAAAIPVAMSAPPMDSQRKDGETPAEQQQRMHPRDFIEPPGKPPAPTLPASASDQPAAQLVAAASSPMDAPVPGLPTRDELLARIPEGLSEERYNSVYAKVNQRYNHMMQATSSERAQTLAEYKGGLAMLQDGRDFPIDPDKYRRLFPTDIANQMIGDLQDAHTIGEQITAVRGMSLPDIMNRRVANQAVLNAAPGPGYARQRTLAQAFDKAAEIHLKALGQDPAAYVATTNPDIEVAREAAAKEQPQAAAQLRGNGIPSAAEGFATKTLAEQERLGVPEDGRHVLSNNEMQGWVQKITSDPEHSPETLKALQQHWGAAWPSVWRDLSTSRKTADGGTAHGLPVAYQMVGGLENEGDGALLARALTQSNKEGINKPLDEVLDRGAVGTLKPSYVIRQRIEGDDRVHQYVQSLRDSGSTPGQIADVLHAVTLLGQAKAFYHNEEPAAAGDHAIESAIGSWEFMPNGSARIPRANSDAITQNARAVVSGLSLGNVQVPKGVPQGAVAPGSATPDDWLRQTQAAPNWYTVGNAIRLVDPKGRFVRQTDGNFVEVPFTVAPITPRATAPLLQQSPF